MSIPDASTSSVVNSDLEWIELRKELNSEAKLDYERMYPPYKYNWYIPVALVCTISCFWYGLYHMDCPRKSVRGAYARVTSQFITGSLFVYGYLKYIDKEKAKAKNSKSS